MGAGASFIDVEELTEALEQDFARVVPRTPRGSLDVASCDRGKVRQVVDNANKRVEKRYADAWNKCAVVRGETIPAVDELRDACAALVDDFHAPRCTRPSKGSSPGRAASTFTGRRKLRSASRRRRRTTTMETWPGSSTWSARPASSTRWKT